MKRKYGVSVFTAAMTMVCMFLMVLLLTGNMGVEAAGTSYYVDSVSGNDNNNGTSQSTPWKTLSKVNAATFAAGDSVYLKAGSVFKESLIPGSSGASGSPVTFNMYGTGSKPVIDATGVADPNGTGVAAVKVYNKEYLEFYNLDITNNPTDVNQKYRVGFLLANNSFGRNLNNIVIKDCNIHDIALNRTYTENAVKEYPMGGISIFHNGASSAFNGITIENVTMARVANTGIYEVNFNWDTKAWNPDGVSAPRSSNVVVRNVSVTDSKGNGIAIGHANGTLIEKCTVNTFAQYNDHFVGIWIHNTNNSMIQFCEAAGGVVTGYDSQGYDLDLRVVDSIIQYSYSRNNAGGFLLNCVTGNSGNIVRYNVSQNDGVVLFKALAPGDSYYNNTAYIGAGMTTKVWGIAGASGYFCNNIIVSYGTTKYKDSGTVISGTHNNNCYYGVTFNTGEPGEGSSILADPQLIGGGTGGSGLNTLNGYKLKPTSPCKNTGIYVAGSGGKDFFGNKILQYDTTFDIGAHEYGDGCDLQFDNFEGGTDNGWTKVSGSWTVNNNDTYVFRQNTSGVEAIANKGNTGWGNYYTTSKVRIISGAASSAGLLGRYTAGGDFYMLRLNKATSKVELYKKIGTTYTPLQTAAFTITDGQWYYLKLVMNGSTLQGYVDGKLLLEAQDTSLTAGKIGYRIYNGVAECDEVGAGHN